MARARHFVSRLALAAAAFIAGGGAATAAPDLFPHSSQINLRQSDLTRLDCNGLWRARNEIYARNGFRFQTARGQAEFGTNGWTSNPPLNAVEQANIALIQRIEGRFCP
ncbi:MAG: YARHG domain-containing protein [Bauldia sp.]